MFPASCGGPATLLPSSYLESAYEVAKNTNPGFFHNEDVLFTGIIRIKSGVTEPVNVNRLCTHYNTLSKAENIRSVVFNYCYRNNIQDDLCLL